MPKDIIKYQHNGTTIYVRNYWNKIQLLFDDAVVDTQKGIISFGISLHGKLGNDHVDVKSTLCFAGENIHLSINDCIVAKVWKA